MRRRHGVVVVLALGVLASGARAQEVDPHRGAGVGLTIGPHTVRGGVMDFRTGVMFDLLAAIAVRSTPRWTAIAAGGGSVVFGGFGDRCLLKPDGTCAPKANFTVGNILGGIDLPVGRGAVRALAGPAVYSGAGATSFGVQGRVDAFTPTLGEFALGLMLRTTVLPSHGGARLLASAMGVGVAIR